ncbi:hypothetical protein CAC42_581 [Sphaceloma murrayae]|uniref:CRAL-TRIO domain-containing protein n=1 Tax=Sphaceloma murrayae TaxID=2082308 RepID=A0A2K1R444_9PEZI|nr:hypothetical protein CAC42_581 [Sphaceloma murrayae]
MASKEDILASEQHAYPVEHIGHLKPHHIQALEEFKAFCAKKKYYRPGDGHAKPSHDDETMLRYLRARKYNVQEAWTQFKDTEDWRKENQIDKLYECIDVQEYDAGRKLVRTQTQKIMDTADVIKKKYPQWTGRRDKRGIPLYLFEVQHLTAKAVAAYEKASAKPGEVQSKLPPKMLRLFALYENLCNFALPLCSYIPDRTYPETPVSQSSNIVDISNVSLKQFWNLKNHMQDASTLATAHYPETLDRIFIIGAPSFFPTVWGWVKRWFDPITVSKIFILNKASTLATLEDFIDRADIPKKYGGDLEFEFGDLPNIDPKITANMNWITPHTERNRRTFPTGPIQWKMSPTTGAMTAVAVGTVDGKQRHDEVASIINLPTEPTLNGTSNKRPITPTNVLHRLPSAVSTHPPSPPSHEIDLSNPPSATTTPASSIRGAPTHSSTPTPTTATHPPVNAIPYRQPMPADTSGPTSAPASADPHTAPGAETTTSVRSGTTATRLEQQSSGHGHGQLETHTPEVRETQDGDKHGVMEPATVSQAPKVHPVPEQEGEEGPGLVERAKVAVAGVAQTVIGAVGIDYGDKDMAVAGAGAKEGETGKGESNAVVDEKGDKEVENAKQEQVEEFLRSQSRSVQGQKVLD